jgi:hypothetical protein
MVLSQNKNQKGGSCGMGGVCSLQMGGRRKSKSKSKRTHKRHGGGCGCGASASTIKQFGGKKRRSKKRHSKKH